MRPLTGRACLELAGVVDLLRGYDKILVPEMNNGQLVTVLRAQYLVPAEGLNQISGLPFKVSLHVHESVSEGERIVVTYGPGRPFLGILMCEKPSTKGVVRLQRA